MRTTLMRGTRLKTDMQRQASPAVLALSVLAGAFALATAAPAFGALALGPVSRVSGRAQPHYAPEAAVSSDGRALVSWGEGASGRIVARLGRAGGAWGSEQTLVERGVPRVQALGSNGTAALAWATGETQSNRRARIYLSIAPPGGRFGAARLVASGTWLTEPTAIVVRPDGEVVLTWLHWLPGRAGSSPGVEGGNPSDLEYATAGAGRPLATHRLVVSGRGSPQLAVDAQGAVLLSGETPLGTAQFPNSQALAATMAPAAQTFAPAQVYAAGQADGYGSSDDELASGPSGVDLLVHLEPESSAASDELLALEPDGRLSPGRMLAPAAVPADPNAETLGSSVALARDGALVRAMSEIRYKREYRGPLEAEAVFGVVTPANAAALSPPRAIFSSPLPTLPLAPVTVAFGEATVAVWQQDVRARSCQMRLYYAVRLDGQEAFSHRAPLSPVFGERGNCGSDEVAFAGGGGRALAAWEEHGAIAVRWLSD